MPGVVHFIKKGVRELRAYSLAPDRARVKLNQNENPWDAPQEIRLETLNRLQRFPWSRYPDFVSDHLHKRLADFAGWDPAGIISGNGSNELIQALLMVSIETGKRVLINEPTFALYRQITTILGGEIVSVPLTDQLEYDVTLLRKQIESSSPDVTIICSPNNPTGCVLDQDELELMLETTPGLVVVDEAYHEFSGETVMPLLRRHPNLVVLRTFSKAMAMAGLRVGYLLAAPELVKEIRKAMLPYNLNVISQIAAEVAIERYDACIQPLVNMIVSERERLFLEMNSIPGLTPIPSRANFMVVRSVIQPRRVFEELLRREILIRDVSGYPKLKDYFRVSVGKPEENRLLLSALGEICNCEVTNQ